MRVAKYRIVKDQNGLFQAQVRVFLFFWEHVDIWRTSYVRALRDIRGFHEKCVVYPSEAELKAVFEVPAENVS